MTVLGIVGKFEKKISTKKAKEIPNGKGKREIPKTNKKKKTDQY